jgi:hypothetical protein
MVIVPETALVVDVWGEEVSNVVVTVIPAQNSVTLQILNR